MKNQANVVKAPTKLTKVMNMAYVQASNIQIPILTLKKNTWWMKFKNDGCQK
jgi:hypothetical protein